MKKENQLNFQSYDYEDETYYLPKIKNVKEILARAKEAIKSEDDFDTGGVCIGSSKDNPKIHDIFYKIFRETIDNHHISDRFKASKFKKNLIAFRDALNKLNIDNKNTYSDVE